MIFLTLFEGLVAFRGGGISKDRGGFNRSMRTVSLTDP